MIDLNPTVSVEAGIELRESIIVAKVKDLLRWVPPSEPHVGFLVRANLGATADPDAEPTVFPITEPQVSLRDLAVTANAAGERYSFAVSAINAAGNEGAAGLLEDVIVDFTVPGAPTGLEIVAS